MKILQVITGFGKAAGTTVFCGEICNGLAVAGHDVTLALLAPEDPDRYQVDSRVHVVSIASLLADGGTYRPDVAHFHVIWLPVMHRLCKWAKQNGVPIVWSPHGTLTPWAMRYHWWKKWPIWWLYQKRDLLSAALLHATAESEVEDFRRMGLANRACIAPLGVYLPTSNVQAKPKISQTKILLFVSRVQRKKGLLNLVEAWAALPRDIRSGWKIRIVGPDQEGHVAEVMGKCRDFGVEADFEIAGPKFGSDLEAEYCAADLFVLPTHSENFGSVVIEALAHGLPVITTKGAPWNELPEKGCGWWVDIGVKPLADALATALSLDDATRIDMGKRGRALVEAKYTWNAVVLKMEDAYKFVCNAMTEKD